MFKNKIKFFLLTVIFSFLIVSDSFASGSIRVSDITTNFEADVLEGMNNKRMIRINFENFPIDAIKDDRDALFYNCLLYTSRCV